MWERFVETVGKHFRFLETEFGFAQKTTKPPLVVYASDKVLVLVYYGAGRHNELDLRIRRLVDDPGTALSVGIGILMCLKDGPDTEGYPSPFPSTPEVLEAEVRRLAELLRKYGSAVLKGDLRDFDHIEQLEKELTSKFGPKNQSPTV